MFGETSIWNAGRRSLHLVTGVSALGALLLLGSTSASAASGTQVMTGATSGGVLSIAAPGGFTLPHWLQAVRPPRPISGASAGQTR